MNINDFWEFITLYEIQNYSDASYRLFISESSLSRHIKAMEQELGAQLFDRTSRGVVPTQYGEILFKYAKQILELRNQYTAEFRQLDQMTKNAVIVQSNYHVHSMLNAFKEFYPDIFVSEKGQSNPVRSRDPITIDPIDALKQDMCTIAFSLNCDTGDPDNSNIEMLLFEHDYYCAIMSDKHHLAHRTSITFDELSNEEFISWHKNSATYSHLMECARNSGFTPKIICYAENAPMIASLAKHTGVGLILKKLATRDNFPDIALVDIEPHIRFDIYLCYRKDRQLSENTQKLIDFALHKWPAIKDQC